MPEMLFDRAVMSFEIQEEHIRGIEYGKDVSRFPPWDNGVALFKGDHGDHLLVREESGEWRCNCRSFHRLRQLTDCRHIIATERIPKELAIPVQRTLMTRPTVLQFQRH